MLMPNTTPTLKATIVNHNILPFCQTGEHSPRSFQVGFGQVIGLWNEAIGVEDELGTNDAVFVQD